MLVQCPKCKTTYKVSDEVVKGTSPAFRCSRCKHTFELEPAAPVQPRAGELPPEKAEPLEPGDESELSFTFGANAERGESQDRKSPGTMEPGEFMPPREPETPNGGGITDEQWSMSAAKESHEKPFTMTASSPLDERSTGGPKIAEPHQSAEASPSAEDATDNIVPISTFRDQAASTVPYLTLFGLLVIFFFLATAYLEAHPKISESVVRSVPLIGPSVVRNGYLKNGVLLKSLRAAYQNIQGNREVLVVSGEAVNQNPVVIREVRVLGQLYNQQGKAIEQQVIWVGNALSLKIVRGMSTQDIVDLQRLKPLKSFDVPPGDSISFAIVFLRPTKEVKEFSCEVLSAEGEG